MKFRFGARKPVVGIGGFFGHGNFGDELFLSVFKQYLGGEFELRVLPELLQQPYFKRPVAELVSEVDAILIGGGDLVQPWNVDARYFNRAYLEKPTFIVGVGVPLRTTEKHAERPHITDKYRHFFRHPNLKFLGVRDEQAANWICKRTEPTVEVVEGADIVCALDLPAITRRPEADPILGIVTRERPKRETPDDYQYIEASARHAMSEGWKVRHIILGTGPVGQRDFDNAGNLNVEGKQVYRSESLTDLCHAIGECSAFMSMKFHGTVVATMYGIPSVVMVPTNKNKNFMARMGRDDLVSRFDAPNLARRITPIPAAIDPTWVKRLRLDAIRVMDRLKTSMREALLTEKAS